jgi:hypothetical protein
MEVIHATAADISFSNATLGYRRETYTLQAIGIFDLKRHSFKQLLSSSMHGV